MFTGITHTVKAMRTLGLSLWSMAWLLCLNIIGTFLEGIGVGMLLPIFEVMKSGHASDIDKLQGAHWDVIRSVAASVGLTVTLSLLLGVSFTFILIRQAFRYFNLRTENTITKNAADRIRQRTFMAFLRAETSHQDRGRAGEIAANLTVELGRALSSLFATVQSLGRIVQILMYVGGLLVLSPPMTTLSIIVIGLAGFLARGLLAEVKRSGAAISAANADLTSFLVERLRHVRLIRFSGTEKAEAAAFGRLSRRHVEQSMHQNMIGARMSVLPEPIAIGFGYLVLLIGGQIFGLSLDKLGMFVVVLVRLLPTVRGLLGDYNNIVGKWPSVERIEQCLSDLREAREPKGGNNLFETLEKGIVYDDVSFHYPESDVPALHNVTVKVPAHRVSALVGPSGAGKSTFVDLLPRMRHPTKGNIFFDGTPIEKFSVASLRAGIAYVPQTPQIFNISAAEHIRYGKENATDEEVREAARLAGALSFIEALPEGFDTQLGEGGTRLSGGQRQRLDIARALVRRAPILILDEPTSALDAEAEAVFRDALKTLRRETDLTIIVIAHRLSTIADADHLIVLNRGRLEGVGTHAQLMAAGGYYARAYKKQIGHALSVDAAHAS